MKFALVISVLLLGVVPYHFATVAGVGVDGPVKVLEKWAQEQQKLIETHTAKAVNIGAKATQEIVDYSVNATSMINNTASAIANSPECRRLIDDLYIITLNISDISNECVAAKMEKIANSRKEVAIVFNEITADLQNLAIKTRNCRKSIFNMPCLVKLGAQATAHHTQKSIQFNARGAKFVALVASLPVSIPYCIFKTGLKELPHNIKKVFSGVQACTTDFVTNIQKLLEGLWENLRTASQNLGIESPAELNPENNTKTQAKSAVGTSEENSLSSNHNPGSTNIEIESSTVSTTMGVTDVVTKKDEVSPGRPEIVEDEDEG